jgi:hypothetical protein
MLFEPMDGMTRTASTGSLCLIVERYQPMQWRSCEAISHFANKDVASFSIKAEMCQELQVEGKDGNNAHLFSILDGFTAASNQSE